MILDAHAQGVDENGDHYPAVEVLAFHDSLQLLLEVVAAPRQTILLPVLPWGAVVPMPARLAFVPMRAATRELIHHLAVGAGAVRVAQVQVGVLQDAGAAGAAHQLTGQVARHAARRLKGQIEA